MLCYDPGELVPQLRSCIIWNKKQHFMYSEFTEKEWVMFIIEDGEIEFDIGGRTGIARKQDMLLCPPNVPFKRKMLRPATFYFFAFSWLDSAGKIINTEHQLLPNPSGIYRFEDRYRITSTCNFLHKISGRTDRLSHNRRNALIWDIWQLYSWEQELSRQDHRRKKQDSLMRKAESFLQENAFSSYSIKQLSQETGLSTAQLTRRFKAYFGITPGDYLMTMRLNKARRLLSETDFKLEFIAKQCGYKNEYYLSRIFSKKIKMSPSEYRRTHQL